MKVWSIAFGGVAFLAGALAFCASTPAQTSDKPEQATKPVQSRGPKKPVHNVEFVTTGDPVALLALRRAPETTQWPSPQATSEQSDAGSSTDPAARKAAEISETEKLIQQKQKRIVLLLRLFATDEQMFLRDPSGEEKDATVKERRKYSQDELLWETAELARLKKRLNELESSR